MNYQEQKAMLAAHQSGTATAEQQRAMYAHLQDVKRRHNADLREAERDARDAYHGGRADAAAETRGEPFGCW